MNTNHTCFTHAGTAPLYYGPLVCEGGGSGRAPLLPSGRMPPCPSPSMGHPFGQPKRKGAGHGQVPPDNNPHASRSRALRQRPAALPFYATKLHTTAHVCSRRYLYLQGPSSRMPCRCATKIWIGSEARKLDAQPLGSSRMTICLLDTREGKYVVCGLMRFREYPVSGLPVSG